MSNYKARLFYGWQYSHETYDVYHAFELVDHETSVDSEGVEKRLAELLDTTPDDDEFGCRSMDIELPDSLIRRIQADAFNGDVRLVVHGNWMRRSDTGEVFCNKCGCVFAIGSEEMLFELRESEHYCGNCGATMDDESQIS